MKVLFAAFLLIASQISFAKEKKAEPERKVAAVTAGEFACINHRLDAYGGLASYTGYVKEVSMFVKDNCDTKSPFSVSDKYNPQVMVCCTWKVTTQ